MAFAPMDVKTFAFSGLHLILSPRGLLGILMPFLEMATPEQYAGVSRIFRGTVLPKKSSARGSNQAC